MKTIQWFPGHMAKAMRMMEENSKLCDAVLYVLDARCPAASFNRRLLEITGTKPVLFVLNKADLADMGASDCVNALQAGGRSAVAISANAPVSARILRERAEALVAEKAERRRKMGSSRPMRFLVAGIPNTGKSTLINLLAGAKKAQTGDKAGVTRGKQWVKCGTFELLDTPGTMPPACENQKFARRLAYVGSIHDEILALDEIALALLGEMWEKYPDRLRERYGAEGGDPLEMLGAVCSKRGFMIRGGQFDYERAERALLDDLRKGKLGRVCFDSKEECKEAGLLDRPL